MQRYVTYTSMLDSGDPLPSAIRFSPSDRKFTMYARKNKQAGNFFVRVVATFSHPMFEGYSESILIKVTILKGNLLPPDFETAIDT
jgi:hypothetical protein